MNKKGRIELERYLETGKYVFHGTHDGNIDVFKPFQAMNMNEQGEEYKDGNPAVFASCEIEIPVFFALFNHQNIDIKNSQLRTSSRDGKITLRATKNKIEYFSQNKISGYVYVFNKKDFSFRNGADNEMVCEKEVKPVAVVEVNNDDIILPIEIINK